MEQVDAITKWNKILALKNTLVKNETIKKWFYENKKWMQQSRE